MKKCTKCKQDKALSDYQKYARNNSGLDTQCKDCRKAFRDSVKGRNLPSRRKRWAKDTIYSLNLKANDY